jgi:AAA family ATP:ADP antiporter
MRRHVREIVDIRREEWPFALSMFGYFFLVVTIFWILKPLKKAVFVGFYKAPGFELLGIHFTAAQAELWAKVINVFVAMGAATLFSWLSDRFVRQQLTAIFSGFFAACYIAYSFSLQNPGPLTIWTFYLFGDLFATLMIATFFVFLNDSVTSDSAKRLYGVIGLGGVLGGAFGSIVVNTLVRGKGVTWPTWMWICLCGTALVVVLAAISGRNARRLRRHRPRTESPSPSSSPDRTGALLEGARLVLQVPYLLAIVSIVGLYEICSTLLDFQFTATVLHFVPRENLDTVFSAAYVAMNLTAVTVQFFFTSLVMRKMGITVALMILPLAILTVSLGYLLAPLLAVAVVIPTADGGFAYSVNQSAKEALYVPTTHQEKYKAKAFIDMFIQRFAKVIAIGMSLVITMVFTEFTTFRWLTLATMGVVSLWLIAARFAGNKFVELARQEAIGGRIYPPRE